MRLDGRIARLIKGTSEFGKELDSLTDFVSFGIAPVFNFIFLGIKQLWKTWLGNCFNLFCLLCS